MKTTTIKIFLIGFFILGSMIIPFVSFADNQIGVQDGEIDVAISPNNPQPYQNVTINISSYATDLNKAVITWQSGGKTILSGIGKTSYSFSTDGTGSSNIFNINIQPVGSISNISKTITINPSEVELMWESADGYTPPFYKGKSLPIKGGLIKVVAIPNTDTIQSGNGNITYTWKNSDSVDLDASGYNKNSYVFKNGMFDNKNEITVDASSIDGSYSAENIIDIPVYNPKLIFYKKSPTEGTLYNNALDKETTMTEDEMTVVAEPYFMPLDNTTNYSWKINGEDISTPSKKTELTVSPSSRGGYATIDMTIENMGELFQKVTNQLKINL